MHETQHSKMEAEESEVQCPPQVYMSSVILGYKRTCLQQQKSISHEWINLITKNNS